jgi:metal-responsive CopG/Arc/MetJ family transcriptional regulator
MVEKVRLNLQMSEELYNELEKLAAESGTTRSDVIRRALGLLKAAYSGRKQGKHLGLARKAEQLDQEFIGY